MNLLKRLDEYDFRARFVPAFIVSVPIICGFIAVFPLAREMRGAILGPTLETVLVLLLVRVARDEGKKIEPAMIAAWDGLPTTRFLRHRNREIEAATRERYKRTLSRVAGIGFPTQGEEAADPTVADSTYVSAVDALRERRRTKSHALVFKENCNYGMVRNLLGLRATGIVATCISAIAVIGGLYLFPATTSREWAALAFATCLLVVVILFQWATQPVLKRTCNAAGKSNDLSLVLRIRHGTRSFLFAGDAEAEAWDDMVERYGPALKSDYLKASHHGRDSGHHPEALKHIAPRITFVSVGRKPDTDASSKYRQQCNKVASTRFYGDMELRVNDDDSLQWFVQRNADK
jgi:hypothetical protein